MNFVLCRISGSLLFERLFQILTSEIHFTTSLLIIQFNLRGYLSKTLGLDTIHEHDTCCAGYLVHSYQAQCRIVRAPFQDINCLNALDFFLNNETLGGNKTHKESEINESDFLKVYLTDSNRQAQPNRENIAYDPCRERERNLTNLREIIRSPLSGRTLLLLSLTAKHSL